MLSSICAQADSIAVAGTHGKTTTTSMLMLVLAGAGLRPSFVVGGDVTDVGTGAQWTAGRWLVVEADESDGTHLELPLHGTILTNVEIDHLDHYGSFDGIVDGFDRYLAQVPGPKVVCGDDDVCVALAARHGAVTYGLSATMRCPRRRRRGDDGCVHLHVERRGATGTHEPVGEIALPLRGLHNVANATGSWPWRSNSALRSTTSPRRSADSVASPVDSTSAESTATPRSSTTTPTSRPRSTPCWPRPARAATAGSE